MPSDPSSAFPIHSPPPLLPLQELQGEVTDEVRAHLHSLRTRLNRAKGWPKAGCRYASSMLPWEE
jgi:hypothetical protein